MTTLILASASPRRQQLLNQLGYSFEIIAPDIIEEQQPHEVATAYVQRLAQEKAQVVLNQPTAKETPIILAADTLIECSGQVLEKPKDRADFEAMMALLSNNEHWVHTAVTVASAIGMTTQLISTKVTFCALTPEQIAAYWETQEPQDKAGGYAIQGLGANFIERIEGSHSAVIGLPLVETRQLLEQHQLHVLL
jgi:septum formation protein